MLCVGGLRWGGWWEGRMFEEGVGELMVAGM